MIRTNEKPGMVVMNRKKTKVIEHKPNTRKTTGKIEKGDPNLFSPLKYNRNCWIPLKTWDSRFVMLFPQMIHCVSSLKDIWALLIVMSDDVISFAEQPTWMFYHVFVMIWWDLKS